jgi:hypothetical protein
MTALQQCLKNLRLIAHQMQGYKRAQEYGSFTPPSMTRLSRIGDDLLTQLDTLVSLLKGDALSTATDQSVLTVGPEGEMTSGGYKSSPQAGK